MSPGYKCQTCGITCIVGYMKTDRCQQCAKKEVLDELEKWANTGKERYKNKEFVVASMGDLLTKIKRMRREK